MAKPMAPTQMSARRRWLALVALILPVLLISMDGTILGFAVPYLSRALDPTASQLLWIIDIYSFVLAGLLVSMGVLGDRIGRRRLLMIGAAGFSIASVVAAFATTAGMLIAARALLGVAGATLMPSTLSLIRNIFTDDKERQFAIAIWATTFAVGAAIGPILGGFLLEHFWWGSIFLVAAPTTAALLLLAPFLLPESKDPAPARFDLLSAALSMATMFPVVFGIKRLAEGGADYVVVASLFVGINAGFAFVRRQRSSSDPMIDISLFAVRRFNTAVSGNLVACMGLAGSGYFVTQYLQLVLGLSPIQAGVLLLPAVGATIIAMLFSPDAARRIGAFSVIYIGLGIAAIGFVLLTRVPVIGSSTLAITAMVAISAGLGAALTVSIDGIIAAVPPERAGAGASVSETANELGTALGTALLGSIAAAVYRRSLRGTTGIAAEDVIRAQETLGEATEIAGRLGGAAGESLQTAANSAFVRGTSIASAFAAVALSAVAIRAFRVRADS